MSARTCLGCAEPYEDSIIVEHCLNHKLVATAMRNAFVPLDLLSGVLDDAMLTFSPPQTYDAFASYVAKCRKLITIAGPSGTAKSMLAVHHLMLAARLRIQDDRTGPAPCYHYAQASRLLGDLRRAPAKKRHALRACVDAAPILLLDDVDKITHWDHPVLRELLVTRHDEQRPLTIMTSETFEFFDDLDPQIARRVRLGRKLNLETPPLFDTANQQ